MKTKITLLICSITLFVFAGNYISKIQFISGKKNTGYSEQFPKSDYTKAWKKVDSLIDKGLSKSALAEVVIIYTKAKTENNAPNFVKAIMYKMKLQNDYEEDSFENSIKDLKSEIKDATFPVKPILHSVLAEMYWRYYSINRYEWMNRTETVNFKEDDIKTWDLKKLVKEVIYNYVLSLQDVENLKKTKLGIYDEIIIKDTATRKLRPTLYDFLAHRSVDFFMNDETELTKPVYKFEINSEDYFKPFDEFVKINITTKDSLSLKYYAAKILQDLIAFHSADLDPSALIDVDLKRLKFVKTNAVLDIKDSLYLQSLLSLESRFSKFPASTDITFEIASEYSRLGALYDPLKSDENKWMVKKAIDKCNEAVKTFANSFGARNCKKLKTQLEQKSLDLTFEEGNAPDKPFRSLVSYKNVPVVYLKILKISYDEYQKLTKKNYGEELIKSYVKLPVIKEFSIMLPDDKDYQKHSAEIEMPQLSLGFYVVLASNNKDFSLKDQIIAYSDFWVTNISFVNRNKENGAIDFYTLDRETGIPLKNVSIQTYTNEYNNTLREYAQKKWKNFRS
ncbi:MAG: hypothetical protein HGB12_12210, partial [Bacteroidetes bacterium]|nr:hypothetical protein [Bacteroidota bacterium]